MITKARIGLGGVAATPLRAYATEDALMGRPWTQETIKRAAAVLGAEGTPMSDHRASSGYRSIMLSNALLKLYAQNTRDRGGHLMSHLSQRPAAPVVGNAGPA